MSAETGFLLIISAIALATLISTVMGAIND